MTFYPNIQDKDLSHESFGNRLQVLDVRGWGVIGPKVVSVPSVSSRLWSGRPRPSLSEGKSPGFWTVSPYYGTGVVGDVSDREWGDLWKHREGMYGWGVRRRDGEDVKRDEVSKGTSPVPPLGLRERPVGGSEGPVIPRLCLEGDSIFLPRPTQVGRVGMT